MANVLSNDEIDALFAESGGAEKTELSSSGGAPAQRKVSTYDFNEINRFSPQQMQALWRLHELAANRLQFSLSSHLRKSVRVELMDIDQIRFENLADTVANPSVICRLDAKPLHHGGLFVLEFGLAFGLLECLLGGPGTTETGAPRELSSMELAVLEGAIRVMLEDVELAWQKLVPLQLQPLNYESDPQYARGIPPKEVVLVVTLGIGGELGFGELRLCFSHLDLEPFLLMLGSDATHAQSDKARNVRNLQRVKVTAQGVLGESQIQLGEVLELEEGDVVPLNQAPGDQVQLRISGETRFLGRLVQQDGELAFLVDAVGPVPMSALEPAAAAAA